MAYLTWDNRYSVGIPAIDKQHNTLFDMVNDLHAAMMEGKAQSVTGPLLLRLANYTKTHFAAEESLMAAKNYPGLESHRAVHRDLIRQVDELLARSKRGDLSVNIDLMNFLRGWLTEHIQKMDRNYAPYLKVA